MEVEAALAAAPGVAQACVVPLDPGGAPGGTQLCALLVLSLPPRQGGAGEALRAALRVAAARLQPHACPAPALTIALAALPTSAHGKLDREAARLVGAAWAAARTHPCVLGSATNDVAPAAPAAAVPPVRLDRLISAAQQALPASAAVALTADTPLVTLGLDSLSAALLAVRAARALGVPVDVAQVLAAPTLRHLAAALPPSVSPLARRQRVPVRLAQRSAAFRQLRQLCRRVAGASLISSTLLHDLSAVWQCPMARCVDASPLVVAPPLVPQPVVVAGCHGGQVACMRLADGQALWRTQLLHRVEAPAVLAPDGGHVLVGW